MKVLMIIAFLVPALPASSQATNRDYAHFERRRELAMEARLKQEPVPSNRERASEEPAPSREEKRMPPSLDHR